jgi:hypothetical protein
MSLARRSIWDLGPPAGSHERKAWLKEHGGPCQVDMFSVAAGEALERDPARYVEHLPDGVEPGPKHGTNRVILC